MKLDILAKLTKKIFIVLLISSQILEEFLILYTQEWPILDHKAPTGQFRVIAYDCSTEQDWIEDDFATLQLAHAHISEQTNNLSILRYISDENGQTVGDNRTNTVSS